MRQYNSVDDDGGKTAVSGDVVHGHKVSGDMVGGDKIIVGDVEGSYNAIGAGASVIVNQIQQALSAVSELEKSTQVAEQHLVSAIQKKLNTIAKIAASEDGNRANPYKALLDYELQDAPFFYGRSEAINAMQEKMRHNQLTILYSESGSGKTSLMQAGLASRLLAEGHFPLYLRPYRQSPEQSIKRAFLTDYATQPELSRFCDDQMSLKGFLERVTHYLGDRHLYIFLDQFEEFFTELSLEKQQAFIEQLQLILKSDLSVRWVFALRKEYFSDLRSFRIIKTFDNAYFLPTFKIEEAQEVIIEPAARKGVRYEEGLVDKILSDLDQGADGIAPVQMQLACYTLFEELADENELKQISWSLYEKPRGHGAAGVEGILASHLARVLDREMSGRERQTASRALEALTTSRKMRVKKSRHELIAELDSVKPEHLDEILEILYNSRLIRQEKDENDESIYELAHDYLLAEIDLDPETQGRKLAYEITNQELLIWQKNDDSRIAADKLVMIDPFLIDLNLSPEAQTLITMSQEAVLQEQEAKEKMRKRQLYMAWSVAAVLAIIAGILFSPFVKNYYYQRQAKAETWLVTFPDSNPPFQLEGREVSNLQYSFCVETGACSLPKEPTYGYLNPEQSNAPIAGVTAYQAYLYCNWIDRQLPSFVDWEKALQALPSNDQLLTALGTETKNEVSEWTMSFVSGEGDSLLWDGQISSVCVDGDNSQDNCDGWILQAVYVENLKETANQPESSFIAPFESSSDVRFRCVINKS